jgi:hypothetical protein
MMPPPAAFLCEGSIIVARASVPSLYYSKCINTALHVPKAKGKGGSC